MGRGIAQWFAQQHVPVWLTDVNPAAMIQALASINENWQILEVKGKVSASARNSWRKNLHSIDHISQMSHAPDLIIEAVVEDLEIKSKLLQTLSHQFGTKPIYASNTSSLSLSQLATALPAPLRSQLVGIHFFNPAPIMKLVELVQSPFNQTQMLQDLKTWFTAKGKEAVVCRDRPGLIVNRLARNFYGEAMRLATAYDEESYATIDKIMTEIGGHPMGPFALMDYIGLDINLAATKSVWQQCYYPARLAPHFLQEQLVLSQQIGKKSGRGFYHYPAGAPAVKLEHADTQALTPPPHTAIIVNPANQQVWNKRNNFLNQANVYEYFSLADLKQHMQSTSYEWICDLTVLPAPEKHLLLQHLSARTASGLISESNGESIVLLEKLFPKIRAATATALPASTGHLEAALTSASSHTSALLHWLGTQLECRVLAHHGKLSHLVLGQIIAMIINESFHAKQEQLCSEAEMDLALRNGTNYPRGPWQWLEVAGPQVFYTILHNLQQASGEQRYAPHALLYQAALIAQSSQHATRGHQ